MDAQSELPGARHSYHCTNRRIIYNLIIVQRADDLSISRDRDRSRNGGAVVAEDATEQAGELSREDLAADGAGRVAIDRATEAAADLGLGLSIANLYG